MDSESRPPFSDEPTVASEQVFTHETSRQSENPTLPPEEPYRGLKWIFVGEDGLRAGWSIATFLPLFVLFTGCLAALFKALQAPGAKSSPGAEGMFFSELVPFLGMVAAAALVSWLERSLHRSSVFDYNLRGPRPTQHFLAGLAIGFLSLSVLVGLLVSGGWLHLGATSLTSAQVFKFAIEWGGVFLLVGYVEEGLFRCFLQFTLTRGINFWVALGLVAAICIDLIVRSKGNGVWGVYGIALLGLGPCFYLYRKAASCAGFWQAAWVTSTLFGFVHTSNGGENWIGIFSAAAVGFIFCVSIRVTGSAWWAIGCHASWDWAETYFYGTADSGLVAPGHYLNSTVAGNPFWSGGADGPEGSVLILGVLAMMLLWLLVIYGRKAVRQSAIASGEEISA